MKKSSLGAFCLLLVLTLANTLAFVDRQVISLLVDPIRSTIGATDIEMGLLQGLAFALLFAVFGLPAGQWGHLPGFLWRAFLLVSERLRSHRQHTP